MQMIKMAIWTVGGLMLLVGTIEFAPAQAAPLKSDEAVVLNPAQADFSQPPKRRRPTRVRVYPNFSSPGPNAVRQCEAHYEQEFRQSGTVIVPRMHCWWQRG
jgi:hypothetical protein